MLINLSPIQDANLCPLKKKKKKTPLRTHFSHWKSLHRQKSWSFLHFWLCCCWFASEKKPNIFYNVKLGGSSSYVAVLELFPSPLKAKLVFSYFLRNYPKLAHSVPQTCLKDSSEAIKIWVLCICSLHSCRVGFDDLLINYPAVKISPSQRKCHSNKVKSLPEMVSSRKSHLLRSC